MGRALVQLRLRVSTNAGADIDYVAGHQQEQGVVSPATPELAQGKQPTLAMGRLDHLQRIIFPGQSPRRVRTSEGEFFRLQLSNFPVQYR